MPLPAARRRGPAAGRTRPRYAVTSRVVKRAQAAEPKTAA